MQKKELIAGHKHGRLYNILLGFNQREKFHHSQQKCETELTDVPVLLYTCICALCILWLILKFYHFQPWRTKLICCIICFNFVNPYGIHGKWQKRLFFFNPDGLNYWIGLIAGCSFLDVFLCFFAFFTFHSLSHTPKLSSHCFIIFPVISSYCHSESLCCRFLIKCFEDWGFCQLGHVHIVWDICLFIAEVAWTISQNL